MKIIVMNPADVRIEVLNVPSPIPLRSAKFAV